MLLFFVCIFACRCQMFLWFLFVVLCFIFACICSCRCQIFSCILLDVQSFRYPLFAFSELAGIRLPYLFALSVCRTTTSNTTSLQQFPSQYFFSSISTPVFEYPTYGIC